MIFYLALLFQIDKLKDELNKLQSLLFEKDDIIKSFKEQKSQALATYKKASDDHIDGLIKQSIAKDKEIYVSILIFLDILNN